MRVAIRCIYYKAVNPSCDIIDMNDDTWSAFLKADKSERIEIILKLLDKEYLSGKVKDIAWFPLSGQNKLVEVQSPQNIAEFTEKYINFFEREFGSIESKYHFFDRDEFPEDCRKLGFEMDCGHSFQEEYGESTFYDNRALMNVLNQIDSIQLIGNALFSQWRYYNHWDSPSNANPDTKEWFLLLLRRLRSIGCRV